MKKVIILGIVLVSIVLSGCGQEEKREAQVDTSFRPIEVKEIEVIPIHTEEIITETILTETILVERDSL